MQLRACLFSAFFAVAGTVPAAAAEMNCPVDNRWQDALNKGDTSAVAALYTSDAVEVTPDGIRVGPTAVKERLDDSIKEGWKQDVVIVATKCDNEGTVRWLSGSWKQGWRGLEDTEPHLQSDAATPEVDTSPRTAKTRNPSP